MKKEVEKLLQYVQKPARYIGGELNAVVKDKRDINVGEAFQHAMRFAFLIHMKSV